MLSSVSLRSALFSEELRQLRKRLISVLLACAPCPGFAGSPDGLQLVVLGTSQAEVAQSKIARYFAEYEKSQGNFDCEYYSASRIRSTVGYFRKPSHPIETRSMSAASTAPCCMTCTMVP